MPQTDFRHLEAKNFWKLIIAFHSTKILTVAARQVGISVSSASKLIANFEESTGITLLDRKSRPVHATKNLESLLPAARRLLGALEEAESTVNALSCETSALRVRGRLVRIALPINVRNDRALASLLDYAKSRDGLRLSFYGDECYNRLVKEEVEIAQFGFFPNNPEIYAEYIRTNGFFILASKKFINKYGVPSRVDELVNYPMVIRNPSNRSFSRRLQRGSETFFIPENPNVIYGDTTTCLSLLKAGRAISLDVSLGSVLEELKRGEIVPILHGWHRKPNDTYVCCQTKNSDDPIIRDLMTIIRTTIREEESDDWKRWANIFGIDPELLKESV